VRFTAPTSGLYNLSGLFELLDTNPSGVIVSIYFNSIFAGAVPLTTPGAMHPGTPGETIPFGASSLTLAQGDTIDFGVNNDGSFYDDSTGLALTISTVPEPAACALMLVGFGGLGATLRASRRKMVAAIA
jgi:hypothetical protein